MARLGGDEASELLARWADAIPETYKADVPAAYAVSDLTRVRGMVESGTPVAFDLWEAEGFSGGIPVEDTGQPGPDDRPRVWRLTIYRTGSPITLTDVLPRLHHLGVEVVDEHPYEFSGPGLPVPFWIYDFGLRPTGARTVGRGPGRGSGAVRGGFPGAHGRVLRPPRRCPPARRILARSKPWSRTRSTHCGAARSRTTGSTPWCWTPI